MGQILFAPAGAGVTSDDVTATKAQVLSGYTALTSDSDDEAASGSMTNNGAWTSSSSGSGKITIPAGYHNGSGYVDCTGAYNKGVTDADNRTNSNSANYKAGYNSGYTNGNAHVTYKDFRVTARAASQASSSAASFSAHVDGWTMVGYGLIRTGGVGWNWYRPYTFNISNSGETITVSCTASGGYDDTSSIPDRWANLDCTVRVFYK